MFWNKIVEQLRAKLADQQAIREFGQLRIHSPETAAAVAGEFGLAPSELARVVTAGRRASRLQEKMMTAFGLRPEALSPNALGALRDASVTCSLCPTKRRCAVEHYRGTARANAATFCPNAETFEALVADLPRGRPN